MNICFICTGNTCRSPLAEGILKSKQLKGIDVRSAGIYASEGMPIASYSRHILEEAGMPVTETSHLFNEADGEWADLILTMTASHRDTIRRAFRGTSDKVFTLKEYVGERQLDVMDPYGGDEHVYEQTFKELSQYIDVLTRKLMEEQS